jgi:protein-S-isoprenylcysteine O-methyltransferase Ste14
MTTTAVLAYFTIAFYFVIERWLRKGENALNLHAGAFDRGSSRILWLSGVLNIMLVLVAPVLNANQIGYWSSEIACWVGILMMFGGLTMRYWAAKTLGEFYTRTLQIVEGQKIVDRIPYSFLRHPGYLGTFLMEIGAGLAIANWVVLVIIVSIGLPARFYRIQAEEEMLEAKFGEQYQIYSTKTWRLIPLIY